MALIAAFWLWLAGGLLLLGLEMVAPGIFLLWIGLAAIGTGLVAWVLPLGFVAQLLVFAALGLGAIMLGSSIQKRQKNEITDAPFLNDRAGGMIGKVFMLETAIASGEGTVRIGDSVWRVAGVDAAAGTKVTIVGIDNGTLRVQAADG
jgi:inner membrane protein